MKLDAETLRLIRLELHAHFTREACEPIRLRLFPGGFMIAAGHCPVESMKLAQRRLSRRMHVAVWADRFRLLFPKRVELPWPRGEAPLHAARVSNGTLMCWTEDHFIKIPLNAAAATRVRTSLGVWRRMQGGHRAEFFHPLGHVEVGDRIRLYSPRGTLPATDHDTDHETRHRKALDEFCAGYFQAALPHRAQHGDLHINNIIRAKTGRLGIIDLDQYSFDGRPMVDLLSLATHFLAFHENEGYPEALREILSHPHQVREKLAAAGWIHCAEFWKNNFDQEDLRALIQNRRAWIQKNSPESQFAIQVEEVLRDADKTLS